MSCLDAAQIAQLATSDDDDPHVGDCLACRRRVDADRSTRAALQALPVPQMSPSHRRALAAEIIATVEHAPRTRRWKLAAGATSALAATLALVAWWPAPSSPPPAFTLESSEPSAVVWTSVARVEAPPVLAPPTIEASGGARLSHYVGADRDVLALADGVVEIDTRFSRNVDVKVGDAVVHVEDATVKIRASKRALVSVQVIVGTAHIESREQRVTLQRDSLWLPGPSTQQRSLTAFRDGWIALRAGRNRDAVELFDLVTDPIVLEEATYWAAVAARRSGDAELASRRFAEFLRKFPRSEYAAKLRAEP